MKVQQHHLAARKELQLKTQKEDQTANMKIKGSEGLWSSEDQGQGALTISKAAGAGWYHSDLQEPPKLCSVREDPELLGGALASLLQSL